MAKKTKKADADLTTVTVLAENKADVPAWHAWNLFVRSIREVTKSQDRRRACLGFAHQALSLRRQTEQRESMPYASSRPYRPDLSVISHESAKMWMQIFALESFPKDRVESFDTFQRLAKRALNHARSIKPERW